MSNVTRRGPVKPSLNITPLIDVVFLLIVFFMIVNNIVTDDVPELQLPDIDNPATAQHDAKSRIIVNIIPDQEFNRKGDTPTGPGNPIDEVLERTGGASIVSVGHMEFEMDDPEQMDAFVKFVAGSIQQRLASDPNKPPMLLLRADATIYYHKVRFVMNQYLKAMIEGGLDPEMEGATSIHFVAYMPE